MIFMIGAGQPPLASPKLYIDTLKYDINTIITKIDGAANDIKENKEDKRQRKDKEPAFK